MTTKLTDFQEDLLETIYQGNNIVMMIPRQHGKSMFSSAAFQRLFDDVLSRPIEELVLTEGRIHGSRYFCVEPVGGNWSAMEAWAKEVYGAPGDVWPKDDFNWPENMRWCINNRKFWFQNEKDRTIFILKWR